jgi:large subunit ribosomal protein L3
MLRAMSRAGGGLLGGGLLRRASAALAAEPASARVAAPASVAPWIGGGASTSSSRLLGAPLGARFVGASAASLAKPGRIKEYALFKDHHFDELGIPRPGSERRRRRVGLVAVKCGMTREWNEHGVSVPLTVLWVDDCEVRTSRRRARIPPRRLSPRPSLAALPRRAVFSSRARDRG